MSKLTEVEKAWLACAIDSEGSIIIGKAYRKGEGAIYVPAVTVSNTNKDYINECEKLIWKVTGGAFSNEHDPGKHKKIYRICISSFIRVIALLEEITPYLIIKKIRADNLIKWNMHRNEKKKLKQQLRYDEKDLEFIKIGRELETSKWKDRNPSLDRKE